MSRWSSNRWSWKVSNRSGCVAIQGHKSTSFPERSPTCKRRECSRTPHSSAYIKTLASQPSLVNPGPKGSDNIDSLAVSPTPETSKYTFPSAELCRHVSSFNVFFISHPSSGSTAMDRGSLSRSVTSTLRRRPSKSDTSIVFLDRSVQNR